MAKANDKQFGGSHYKTKKFQPWDYVLENQLGYLEGTAVKYITRWKDKGGLVDIQKAIHYLEKLIEYEMEKPATLDSDVPDAVKQYGGLAGSMDAAQGLTNFMGGLRSASDVAGQAWHGFTPDTKFLYDPTALNDVHLGGGFDVNDNV